MCVKHFDTKEFRFSFLLSPFLKIKKQGGGGDVEELGPTKLSSTPQENVPALYPPWAPVWAAGGYHSSSETSLPRSATKMLQGSAKKQIGICEDFRRCYSLQGAMQVCDLDWHSVKGPGVDATYHVPSAEAPVSSIDLNVLSQPVPI